MGKAETLGKAEEQTAVVEEGEITARATNSATTTTTTPPKQGSWKRSGKDGSEE